MGNSTQPWVPGTGVLEHSLNLRVPAETAEGLRAEHVRCCRPAQEEAVQGAAACRRMRRELEVCLHSPTVLWFCLLEFYFALLGSRAVHVGTELEILSVQPPERSYHATLLSLLATFSGHKVSLVALLPSPSILGGCRQLALQKLAVHRCLESGCPAPPHRVPGPVALPMGPCS